MTTCPKCGGSATIAPNSKPGFAKKNNTVTGYQCECGTTWTVQEEAERARFKNVRLRKEFVKLLLHCIELKASLEVAEMRLNRLVGQNVRLYG